MSYKSENPSKWLVSSLVVPENTEAGSQGPKQTAFNLGDSPDSHGAIWLWWSKPLGSHCGLGAQFSVF